MRMSTYNVFVLFSLVSTVMLQECNNKCNINEVPTADCNECQCMAGYFKFVFSECKKCKTKCPKHFVKINPCQGDADLLCSPCPKGNYYKSSACHNCTTCQYGMLDDCGVNIDTKCVEVVTLNTTSTVIKWRRDKEKNIFKYICWILVAFIVLLLSVIVFLMVRRQSNTTFCQPPVDTSTESALNLLPKTGAQHCNGNFKLTEEELEKHIRVLPCTYAEELAKLLNPESFNNWTSLAGVLKFTQTDIANWKNDNAHFTQNVLFRWSFTNTATVGALLSALLYIERHDAISTLCAFIIKQRDDAEDSVVLSLDEVSLTDSMLAGSCIVEVAETCI